eukprot:GFYU01007036.1.p1 GENE.GFYU01007036.1~~GFYU01007036.1.p1  ORF type:complete len:388 (-),score=76.54 GFYU01007036.1:87-1250(-)
MAGRSNDSRSSFATYIILFLAVQVGIITWSYNYVMVPYLDVQKGQGSMATNAAGAPGNNGANTVDASTQTVSQTKGTEIETQTASRDAMEDTISGEMLYSNSRANAKYAVVIPYIKKELPMLLARMRSWNTDAHRVPCRNMRGEDGAMPNRQFDLVFYFSRDAEKEPEMKVQLMEALGDAAACFNEVRILSCGLNDRTEAYERKPDGTVKSLGPMYLLYTLFFREDVGGTYEYMFYMEADILHLKPNWLDRTVGLIRHGAGGSPFWMMGSGHRGPTGDDPSWDYLTYYINGACTLFRVGDVGLQNFVRDCVEMYGGVESGNDIDMLLATCRVRAENRHHQAKFLFTDTMYHHGSKWQYEKRPWRYYEGRVPEECTFFHSTSLVTDVP